MNNPRTYDIGSGAGLGPARKLRFSRFNEPNDYGVVNDMVIVLSQAQVTVPPDPDDNIAGGTIYGDFKEVARIDLTRGMVFGPENPHGHTPKGVRVDDLRVIDEYLEDLRKEDDDG